MDSEPHDIYLIDETECQHPYDKDIKNINNPNDNGKTVLHIAAQKGCRNCCEKLIKLGANLAATDGNTQTPTPFKIIYKKIDKPVDFLITNIFNKCINYETTKNPSTNYIKLDFTPLIPLKNGNQMEVITNLLEVIKEKNQRHELMRHPLIKSFLELKWAKVQYYYYVTIFIYMIFVGSLSAYVMILVNTCLSGCNSTAFQIIRWFIIVAVFIMIIQAIAQGYYLKKVYLKQFESYVHLGTAITSLLITACITKDTKYWIIHVASIAILLAWINLMMFLGRLPIIGYYALLFGSVFKKVCKVMAIFSFVIFGFAISFSVQFHDKFYYPWKAFIKTLTMMVGEFDYDDLFESKNDRGKINDPIDGLSFTSRVLFLIFIIVASITLINLMVGLSVNDVQTLNKEGYILRLMKQAQFLLHVENLPSRIKRFCRGIHKEIIISRKKVGKAIWKPINYETFDLMKMQAEANLKNEDKKDIKQMIIELEKQIAEIKYAFNE